MQYLRVIAANQVMEEDDIFHPLAATSHSRRVHRGKQLVAPGRRVLGGRRGVSDSPERPSGGADAWAPRLASLVGSKAPPY
jgi:hypothetical protein